MTSRSSRNPLTQLVAAAAMLCALVQFTGPVRAAASDAAPTIDQLQAAMIITIARFVEWPRSAFASPALPIVIAIVADQAVADALEASVAGRNINGRAVVVKRLQWDSDTAGIHLLFVGKSEQRRVAALLEHVRGKPILTVSLLPQFGSSNGMIALTSNAGRLSFSVNAWATGESGLRLTSSLLSHATSVSHQPGPGAR